MLQIIHKYFRFNYALINFWLEYVILPTATKQFPESLKRNSWHVASSFSGKVQSCLSTPIIAFCVIYTLRLAVEVRISFCT